MLLYLSMVVAKIMVFRGVKDDVMKGENLRHHLPLLGGFPIAEDFFDAGRHGVKLLLSVLSVQIVLPEIAFAVPSGSGFAGGVRLGSSQLRSRGLGVGANGIDARTTTSRQEQKAGEAGHEISASHSHNSSNSFRGKRFPREGELAPQGYVLLLDRNLPEMAESDFLPRVTATGPETRVVEMNPRWNSTAKPAST